MRQVGVAGDCLQERLAAGAANARTVQAKPAQGRIGCEKRGGDFGACWAEVVGRSAKDACARAIAKVKIDESRVRRSRIEDSFGADGRNSAGGYA
jgi:hypothetical protein